MVELENGRDQIFFSQRFADYFSQELVRPLWEIFCLNKCVNGPKIEGDYFGECNIDAFSFIG
jgi:hypothetical protein